MKFNYVSYGRSGGHFLNEVLSLYIGKSAPTHLYYPDHDRNLKVKREGCFYVWRNPVKIIFSLFSAYYCNEKRKMDLSLLTDEWRYNEIDKIKKHFKFYWEHAGIVIRYKDVMNNNVWPEILNFFKLPYDEEKILDCASKITLDFSIKKQNSAWMHDFMTTDEYKDGRIDFENKYKEEILREFSDYLNKNENYLTQSI